MTTFARLLALVLLFASGAAQARDTLDVRTDCGARRGCFATISAALAQAERDRSGRTITIAVGPGTFREKPVVRRDHVRLVGRGRDATRLVFDAVAETAGRYDPAGWGTPGSATLTVSASDVRVSGMTVENAFDYLANDAVPVGNPARMKNPQAVAVQFDTGSDAVVFDRVAILGYQDTLFTRGRRAVIRDSLIAGNIDFIFGNGMLLIEDSEIRSRPRAAPVPAGEYASYVAAPSTPIAQPIGIVLRRARLTREAGVADASVALARPWHPTTTFPDGRYADPDAIGQALFLDCWMDAHIAPDAWTSMGGTARDGTKTAIFQPEDARFAERGSTGPGARRRGDPVRWKAVPSDAAIDAAFAGLTAAATTSR